MDHVGKIWYYKEITQLCRRGWDYVWVETCFATNFLKPGKALAIEHTKSIVSCDLHYNLERSVNFSHFRVVGMEARI